MLIRAGTYIAKTSKHTRPGPISYLPIERYTATPKIVNAATTPASTEAPTTPARAALLVGAALAVVLDVPLRVAVTTVENVVDAPFSTTVQAA